MIIDENRANEVLRLGGHVALLTDTVYGIAADLHHPQAILGLFNLKKRSQVKPLVIQLATARGVLDYLSLVPFDLEKIMHHFWPGPLTLVLPIKEDKIPPMVRANLPTAAFRVSANMQVRSLIEKAGPLVITSANFSGDKEFLSEDEIHKHFGTDFPILDSLGAKGTGIASTVLAYVDSSWVILRQGELSIKELRPVVGYNPPVVQNVNFKQKSFTVCPQLHCMDTPYDGSIKVVVGLSHRTYPGADKVIYYDEPSSKPEIRKIVMKIMQEIHQEAYPHIWVDMNFPKSGLMKELASIFMRASQ